MSSLSTSRPAIDPPNILLIVMDAARAKNLSCYGYHRPTTPNLARFAEQCVVYEQAISAAGWTLPSHASIFTGLYPSKHGAHDQHKYLTTNYPTMAALLRARGYQTLAFCYNQYAGPATGLDRGFEWFNHDFIGGPRSFKRLTHRLDHGLAKILGWSDAGARYINRQVQAALSQLQTNHEPFFIFINYLEPHAPYRPPQNLIQYLPTGLSHQQVKAVNQDAWKYLLYPDSMTDQDFEVLCALHDSAITYLDTRIAEVLGWLKQLRFLDRTMVIITADHGENLGEHQLMGHGYCLYDTLLHVPLLIHYPKGVTAPSRVAYQVQTLDLMPTILAMLGDNSSEVYRSLQSYNLLSSYKRDFTIAEQSKPDLKPFHKRFPGVDASRYERDLQMIRTERYKYIWSSDGQYELYNLQADPAENNNLIAQQPNIAADLDWRLTEWRNSFEPTTVLSEAPEFDEKVKAQLRALGYLE